MSPRLKVTDVDIDELENASYKDGGGDFETYEGDIPPAGIILNAFVKKMWLTYTAEKQDGSGGDPMLKILVVADGNDDTKYDEFEGCPFWENDALIASVKFKWQPFLDNFGLRLRDVLGDKSKLYVAEEDDNNGAPIEKIGSWAPGTDAAYCRIVTAREKYQGDWQARIGRWLPWDASDDEQDADDEIEDDPDNEPQDDEAAQGGGPTRGRRTAAKAPAAKATPTSRGKAGRPTQAKAAPARGRRGARATGSDEDPPF
jgi:hypothetical protein